MGMLDQGHLKRLEDACFLKARRLFVGLGGRSTIGTILLPVAQLRRLNVVQLRYRCQSLSIGESCVHIGKKFELLGIGVGFSCCHCFW